MSSKQYLKTDYKHHIKMEDNCPDHCIAFALSEPTDKHFSKACKDHGHDLQCARCNLFPDAVLELKTLIGNAADLTQEERLEFLHDIESAFTKVLEWKSHLLRSVNQDHCRLQTLENLERADAMLVMDWAMKFLPMLHREKQSDWFGQKGFNWHVIVVIYKENDKLKHRTYVHTLESAKQDWFSVALLLEHTLKTVKDQLPHISNVYLRSDNAGCYHCSNLWHSLHGISQRTGITIKQYDFSEAQNGKSYCDAKIAHMRGKMRKFVSEGGNICSAGDMKLALDVYGGVSGCQMAHVAISTRMQTADQSQIQGISKFSNVRLEDGSFICWKAYNVGMGKKISSSPFNHASTNLIVLSSFTQPKNPDGTIAITSRSVPNEQLNDRPDESIGKLFCPDVSCSEVFTSYSDLQDHCYIGTHSVLPTHDFVKMKWKEVCMDISSSTVKFREAPLQKGESMLCPGWALKKERKNTRFSEKVRTYLKGIFDAGERDGQKANPANVSSNMRVCRDENGKKMFSPDDYLQQSQIVSYFSRLAVQAKCQNKKLSSDEDLESAISFINKTEALEELLNS